MKSVEERDFMFHSWILCLLSKLKGRPMTASVCATFNGYLQIVSLNPLNLALRRWLLTFPLRTGHSNASTRTLLSQLLSRLSQASPSSLLAWYSSWLASVSQSTALAAQWASRSCTQPGREAAGLWELTTAVRSGLCRLWISWRKPWPIWSSSRPSSPHSYNSPVSSYL